jgi:small subunit ribosomal protein S4
MGDPRRSKNKWQKPAHPWQKTRIDSEKILRRTYGLSNKKEIWRVASMLKSLKDQAKNLAAGTGSQVEKEKQALLHRTARLGLIKTGQGLDDVLGISVEQAMDRRLQTVVFKKGLARSVRQARQYIVHQHILLGQAKITAPGYIVPISEESMISFVPTSTLASADHPERAIPIKSASTAKKEAEEAQRRQEAKRGKGRGGPRGGRDMNRRQGPRKTK